MAERPQPVLGTAELGALVTAIGSMPAAADDAERIDRLRHFQELTSALAAAAAVETAAFTSSQRAAQAAAGEPAERQGRGVAAQVALARRTSLHAAQRFVGWSSIAVSELPHTLAALRAGRTSEWRAMLVGRETIFLSREHRARVDEDLAPRLEHLSDRAVEVEARRAAYRLDPEGSLARSRSASVDRRVSIRPAPDTMVWLSALLPVGVGVASYAALCKAADTVRSGGDARSRGQVMADTLVERVTGQADAAAVPVEIELVMTADTLLRSPAPAGAADPTPESEPALITAAGLAPMALPAGVARELIDNAPTVWLRRLWQRPDNEQLVAMEAERRLFTEGQRRFFRHRDLYCATPWCGAPIRHADHIVPAARGGPTSVANGRGQCEACNHASQAPGWRSTADLDGAVHTTTPTGHEYFRAPPRSFFTSVRISQPTADPASTPRSERWHPSADWRWAA